MKKRTRELNELLASKQSKVQLWPWRWSYPAELYGAKKPRTVHQNMTRNIKKK